MNVSNKKTFAIGLGAGILLAVLAVGAVTARMQFHSNRAVQPNAVVPHREQQPEIPVVESGSSVQLGPDEITAAGVQTAEVRTGKLKTDIEAFGRVEQPEAQLSTISARIAGRIDKLFLQYTGQEIRKGQPVAEIYSPDIAASLEEYRLAVSNRDRLAQSAEKESHAQAEQLVAASRRRLELWGVTNNQLSADTSAGTPHVTIYSPVSGTVMERKVTRGQYVNSGDMMFSIADLNTVWVKADVYESQLPEVRPMQPVELTSEALPGRIIHGRVEFIEPSANPQTRTVPVHVHVANPGMQLRPGMFVAAKFVNPASRNSVVVPRSAVLDTGNRKLVYLAKPDGVFEAREVEVGAPSEELYPVLRGLAAGDRVVISGNFLIDSQSRLGSGMSGMFGGSKEFSGAKKNSQGSNAPATNASPTVATIKFMVEPDPPKGGTENMFHIILRDASGKMIEGAKVTVTLVMPAMPSMGMPEMRSSFDVPWNSGMYMGNASIPTPGPWNVTVEAIKDGQVIATNRTHFTAK